MKNDSRYIVGGAAVGAVLGAVVGLALSKKGVKQLAQGAEVQRSEVHIESGQLVRLGTLVVSLIRHIMDLG